MTNNPYIDAYGGYNITVNGSSYIYGYSTDGRYYPVAKPYSEETEKQPNKPIKPNNKLLLLEDV